MPLNIYAWHISCLSHCPNNTSYKLTTINNVTRPPGIHAFHIAGTCPCRNIPATLYKYVPLHFYCSLHIDPTLLHTSFKHSKLQLLFTLLQYICWQHISPQMWQLCHMSKLPDVHFWGKYANIHATHEVDLITTVARITVYKWWQWQCHSLIAFTELATWPSLTK